MDEVKLPEPAEAQAQGGVEVRAWMRRWAFDGVDVMALPKKERPSGWQFWSITNAKCLDDDVPLYAAPPSAPNYPTTATCRVCDYEYRCVPVPAKCGACGNEMPPSAPVGVEGLNAAAVEAGHITFESMKQCADSWLAVVDALNTSAPGWCEKKGAGRECAVAAIAALAQQPAAVDVEK